MDQAKNLQVIKRWVEGWPENQEDVLALRLTWPDEQWLQNRIVASMIRKTRDQIQGDRWHTSAVAYEFLQNLCLEFARMIQLGRVRPQDVPQDLLTWALRVAGGTISEPPQPLGRPNADILRDLKILSVTSALKDQLGINQENAKAMIADAVDGLSEDGVHDALRRARAQERSPLGIMVLNMLAIKNMGEKFN